MQMPATQSFLFLKADIEKLSPGEKTSTVRPGVRDVRLGKSRMVALDDTTFERVVNVVAVGITQPNMLTSSELKDLRAESAEALLAALRQADPSTEPTSAITIIRFQA